MKRPSYPILFVLLIVSGLYLPSSFAQDYTQWGLPEGAKARIGKGSINDMQYSPDGTILAVASSVGIWLYDTETYQEIDLLTRNTAANERIVFSPDGKMLVSSEVWKIVLWDVATRKLKKVITESSGYSAVSFSPDGKILVTTDFKTVHLRDAETGESKHTLKGHTDKVTSVSIGPYGQMIASASSDKTIRLWDVSTGKHRKTLTGHIAVNNSIVFSPDGKTLASIGSDKTALLWDVDTGKPKETLVYQGNVDKGTGHRDSIERLSFSSDGGTLVGISADNTIRLWDTTTGTLKRTLVNLTMMRMEAADKGRAEESVTFSPDGRTFVSWIYWDGKSIRLWNESTNEYKSLSGHAGMVTTISFSSDSRVLAVGEINGTIHLWDASTGKHKKTLANYSFPSALTYDAKHIAFSPNGNKLAIGGWNGIVYLWDTITRQQLSLVGNDHGIKGVRFSSVSFSPDGKTLASLALGENNTIRLWGVDTGKHKRTLNGQIAATNISFSPDSRTLATGGVDKSIRLWDVNTGKHKRTLNGHTDKITRVLFSPDGEMLVSGSMDKTIRLWDLETGRHKQTFIGHASDISDMVFSPDARTLASGSVSGDIYLWDVSQGKQKQAFIGHADTVSSIVFGPDGLNFASTSVDGTIRLWDTTTSEQKQTLAGYKGIIWDVFFYTEGLALASRIQGRSNRGGINSQNIDLWNLVTGERKKILNGHTRRVISVSFSADGRTLASGSNDDTVLLWDVPSILNTVGETE